MQENVRSSANVSTELQDLVLGATGERSHHLEWAAERPSGQRRETGKELAVGVGKGIGGQSAERDGRNPVERAPHARLRQQQKVAPGQVDGLVG